MKLPNFLNDSALNSLRESMGAIELGDLTLQKSTIGLTPEELDVLLNYGIDIPNLDVLETYSDKTLIYKNKRVILYIRDVPDYGSGRKGNDSMPRYHVANCRTLIDMRSKKRFGRYVVAARTDGSFQINIIENGSKHRNSIERLKICQNCLDTLSFDGFSVSSPQTVKAPIVQKFTIARFFEIYPQDVISASEAESELTARRNEYTGDFGIHAKRIKEKSGYHCVSCDIDLSAPSMQQFLHAHHMNAIKYDNSESNLKALCIKCHSEQIGHSHMLSLPQYKEFMSLIRFNH